MKRKRKRRLSAAGGTKSMMIKKIELEVHFDDNFVPPDIFNKELCDLCPFLSHEAYECSEDFCGIPSAGDECPIKKYFN